MSPYDRESSLVSVYEVRY